jgi:hypothetical protein
MGFELYLFCYENGRPSGIPRENIRALFPVLEEKSDLNRWQVRYDSENMCVVSVKPLTGNSDRIESLCISRPCGDLRLFDSLFAILRMGSIILVFPGLESSLAASEFVRADIPEDLTESMGPPRVVGSGQEILEVVRNLNP